MQIGRQINKISNHLRRRSQRIQDSVGLSGSQGFVLDYILIESKKHPVYQKDIEKEFGFRPSSATSLIRAMEEKNWITRTVNEKDNRLKQIEFTEAAKDIKVALSDEVKETEMVLTKNISKEDLDIFMKVTNQMLKNLEEDDYGSK